VIGFDHRVSEKSAFARPITGGVPVAPAFRHALPDDLSEWSAFLVLPADQGQLVQLIPRRNQPDCHANQSENRDRVEPVIEENAETNEKDQRGDYSATQPLCGAERLNIFPLCEILFLRISQALPPFRLRILSQSQRYAPRTKPLCNRYCDLLHKARHGTGIAPGYRVRASSAIPRQVATRKRDHHQP
jgi:hypothetical protein